MSEKKKNTTVLDFFAEIGQLKRVRRSGWWTVGIKDGESVADHSFRCAVIGYCIAKMEGGDAPKVALMCLFNDIHEARINDLHKVVGRYVHIKNAEKRALKEQLDTLPREIGASIKALMDELIRDKSREGIIARDADILECMLQGKEYYEQGYTKAKHFFDKACNHLKTKSAKKLAAALEEWDSYDWCKKLAVLKR
ncbi:MAG: HD domain-containing protein [Candidatus Omnitrophica bacterium]|nr:HD domain-containing protein [Candidatus Omnitrophota bacterium]